MMLPSELEKLAIEAQKLILEMSEKLSKYDAKATALLFSSSHINMGEAVTFPENYSNKKLSPEAANKKIEDFIAAVNNPEKYPLETKVKEATEMKGILTEYQQRIDQLYAPAIENN